MAETARVQYVFLDVVGFTRNRSVEAQSDVVGILNAVVTTALKNLSIPEDKTILIPTGDGIAIAILEAPGFDLHLQLALEILRTIDQKNSEALDAMRQFEVRIGINENIDNVLPDINGKRNVAGAGISMAQRIMDKADGGQVLVGQTVFEVLRQREKYFSGFRGYTAIGKHAIKFNVYQYLSKEDKGLNNEVPSVFAPKKVAPEKLTKFAAYFMAHAIRNRDFLLSRKSDAIRDRVAVTLLGCLAEDSVEISGSSEHADPITIAWKAGIATFEEQYKYYYGIDYSLLACLANLLAEKHLDKYYDYFETDNIIALYEFIKPSGVDKLRAEWPEIAKEFGI